MNTYRALRRVRRVRRRRLRLPPVDDCRFVHPFVSSNIDTGYISLRNEDTVEQ